MNKNNIILIGIVLLFLLVIRPLSKKNKGVAETPQEQANVDTDAQEMDVTEINYTPYEQSPYVSASLMNAQHTAPEGMDLQGQTHTL